ncbi:hypothetical protein GDO78_012971 [Eleutherodactylus coqui]|uniref:Uncharacterized protein n=1 Tax=Eleutherodactylus coqui TaxID=57060 RepID=A0A8J6K3T1_ELECQ|nr:hypothetical protein GDO78_012971 [Eleutherodactylus coqui]
MGVPIPKASNRVVWGKTVECNAARLPMRFYVDIRTSDHFHVDVRAAGKTHLSSFIYLSNDYPFFFLWLLSHPRR